MSIYVAVLICCSVECRASDIPANRNAPNFLLIQGDTARKCKGGPKGNRNASPCPSRVSQKRWWLQSSLNLFYEWYCVSL